MPDLYSATSLHDPCLKSEDQYECVRCGTRVIAHMLESAQCDCGSFEFDFIEGNFKQEEKRWVDHLKHEEFKAKDKAKRLAKKCG